METQGRKAFKSGWGKFVTYEFYALVLTFVVVAFFVVSVKTPWMDPFTRRMPQGWRKAVSTAVYKEDFAHDPASHAAMERVVQLYPANTDAWKRRCLWAGSSGDLKKDQRICEKAVEAEPNFPLVVSALGRAQLAAGDPCAAEKSYARAILARRLFNTLRGPRVEGPSCFEMWRSGASARESEQGHRDRREE